MAYVAFDTKEYGLQVESDTPGTFVIVSGMQSLTWTDERDEIETTTDGASYKTWMMGDRDVSLEFEGLRLTDPTTKQRDPGQRLVEKAARTDGAAGIKTYRVVHIDTAAENYIELDAYAMNGDFGGGRNEATPWSITLRPAAAPTFHGPMFDMDDADYD